MNSHPSPQANTSLTTLAEKRERTQEAIKCAKAELERSRQATIEAEKKAEEEIDRLLREEEEARKEEEEAARKEAEDMLKVAREKAAREEAARKEAVRKEEEAARKEAVRKKVAEEARRSKELKDAKKEATTKKKLVDLKGKKRATEDDENEDKQEDMIVTRSAHATRNVIHSDDEQATPTIKNYGKPRKNSAKTPAMINDAGKSISNDIVGGNLYPSCMACTKANVICQWKTSVIHLRLSGIPNKSKNCESCVRRQVACHFIWEQDKSIKRPAEEDAKSESSKRVKLDCPELVSCLQSIDDKIGTLVKFATAQELNNSKEHESECFEVLKHSLEALHKKYNDN